MCDANLYYIISNKCAKRDKSAPDNNINGQKTILAHQKYNNL